MEQKTLTQFLSKYLPPDKYKGILDGGRVSRSRVDKENRILEVFADFEITKGKMDDVFLAATGKKLEGGAEK